MSIVHASNRETPLSWSPLESFLIPDEFGWEVLIQQLACFKIPGIGFEIGSEGCVLGSLAFSHLLNILRVCCIPSDCLLVWKMDIKSSDVRELLMHAKLEQSPYAFTGRDRTMIQKKSNSAT